MASHSGFLPHSCIPASLSVKSMKSKVGKTTTEVSEINWSNCCAKWKQKVLRAPAVAQPAPALRPQLLLRRCLMLHCSLALSDEIIEDHFKTLIPVGKWPHYHLEVGKKRFAQHWESMRVQSNNMDKRCEIRPRFHRHLSSEFFQKYFWSLPQPNNTKTLTAERERK